MSPVRDRLDSDAARRVEPHERWARRLQQEFCTDVFRTAVAHPESALSRALFDAFAIAWRAGDLDSDEYRLRPRDRRDAQFIYRGLATQARRVMLNG